MYPTILLLNWNYALPYSKGFLTQNTKEYRCKQEEFLRDHLGAWVGDFTEQLEKGCHKFLQAFVLVTKTFIEQECREVMVLEPN